MVKTPAIYGFLLRTVDPMLLGSNTKKRAIVNRKHVQLYNSSDLWSDNGDDDDLDLLSWFCDIFPMGNPLLGESTNDYNLGQTINHPPIFIGGNKPFPNVWLMTLFYPH